MMFSTIVPYCISFSRTDIIMIINAMLWAPAWFNHVIENANNNQ